VEDPVGEGEDRAEVGVSTASQANDFASDTIFLGSEGECGKGAGLESGLGCMSEG